MSRGEGGFSLIELVLVILVLAVAAMALATQFTQSVAGIGLDEELQTATRLAEERAEQILADRRGSGYAAVPLGTTTDTLVGPYAVYVRTVAVSAYAGAACPVPASGCRQVDITVSRGAATRARLRFLVANY